MTKENIERLYKHFCEVVEVGGNTGNAVRDKLIKDDAEKNKRELEKKFPELKSVSKEEKPTKSKGAK